MFKLKFQFLIFLFSLLSSLTFADLPPIIKETEISSFCKNNLSSCFFGEDSPENVNYIPQAVWGYTLNNPAPGYFYVNDNYYYDINTKKVLNYSDNSVVESFDYEDYRNYPERHTGKYYDEEILKLNLDIKSSKENLKQLKLQLKQALKDGNNPKIQELSQQVAKLDQEIIIKKTDLAALKANKTKQMGYLRLEQADEKYSLKTTIQNETLKLRTDHKTEKDNLKKSYSDKKQEIKNSYDPLIEAKKTEKTNLVNSNKEKILQINNQLTTLKADVQTIQTKYAAKLISYADYYSQYNEKKSQIDNLNGQKTSIRQQEYLDKQRIKSDTDILKQNKKSDLALAKSKNQQSSSELKLRQSKEKQILKEDQRKRKADQKLEFTNEKKYFEIKPW